MLKEPQLLENTGAEIPNEQTYWKVYDKPSQDMYAIKMPLPITDVDNGSDYITFFDSSIYSDWFPPSINKRRTS